MSIKRMRILAISLAALTAGMASAGWRSEDIVVGLVNEARATGRACGGQFYPAVAPFAVNRKLEIAARAHARDMQSLGYFSHTSRDGRQPGDRTRRAGYFYRAIGENIAMGQQSADQVVAGWLRSPGHCRNIMSPEFDEIGIGLAEGFGRGPIWVQNFGRRQGAG